MTQHTENSLQLIKLAYVVTLQINILPRAHWKAAPGLKQIP